MQFAIPPDLAWSTPAACPDADQNGDGTVNVADAQLAILAALSGEWSPECDTNLDGYCSVADVQLVVSSIWPCAEHAETHCGFWNTPGCDWAQFPHPLGTGTALYAGHGYVMANGAADCSHVVVSHLWNVPVTCDDGACEAEGWPVLQWTELWSGTDGCALEVVW